MWADVEVLHRYVLTVEKQHMKIYHSVVAFMRAEDALKKKKKKKKWAKERNVVPVMVREKSPTLDSYFSLE